MPPTSASNRLQDTRLASSQCLEHYALPLIVTGTARFHATSACQWGHKEEPTTRYPIGGITLFSTRHTLTRASCVSLWPGTGGPSQ